MWIRIFPNQADKVLVKLWQTETLPFPLFPSQTFFIIYSKPRASILPGIYPIPTRSPGNNHCMIPRSGWRIQRGQIVRTGHMLCVAVWVLLVWRELRRQHRYCIGEGCAKFVSQLFIDSSHPPALLFTSFSVIQSQFPLNKPFPSSFETCRIWLVLIYSRDELGRMPLAPKCLLLCMQ